METLAHPELLKTSLTPIFLTRWLTTITTSSRTHKGRASMPTNRRVEDRPSLQRVNSAPNQVSQLSSPSLSTLSKLCWDRLSKSKTWTWRTNDKQYRMTGKWTHWVLIRGKIWIRVLWMGEGKSNRWGRRLPSSSWGWLRRSKLWAIRRLVTMNSESSSFPWTPDKLW